MTFLLLARYVPNVALTDQRPTTDLLSAKFRMAIFISAMVI